MTLGGDKDRQVGATGSRYELTHVSAPTLARSEPGMTRAVTRSPAEYLMERRGAYPPRGRGRYTRPSQTTKGPSASLRTTRSPLNAHHHGRCGHRCDHRCRDHRCAGWSDPASGVLGPR